jgi:hypothetical protein
MRRGLEILFTFTRATGRPRPHLQAAINKNDGMLGAIGRNQEQILTSLREMARELL